MDRDSYNEGFNRGLQKALDVVEMIRKAYETMDWTPSEVMGEIEYELRQRVIPLPPKATH